MNRLVRSAGLNLKIGGVSNVMTREVSVVGFYRIRNDWVKGQIFDTCYGNNRNFGGVFKFRRLREVAGTKEDSGILKSDGTYLKYYHAETIRNDKGGIITFTPNIVIVKKSSLKLVKEFSSPSNQESPLGELAAMQFVQKAKNGPDTCLLSIEELRNLPNHGLVTSIAGFIEFRFHDQFFPDPSKGYDHLYSIVPDCGVDIHTWAHRTYELGIVPEDVCRNIFFQLLNVLTYLRGRNLCHRDICDQNLVWDPVRNHLTLIDLAQLAWAGENPGPRIVDGKFLIAKKTNIYGKIPFKAPEICEAHRREYDGFAVDLWQSVTVLWIMRTGSYLFGQSTILRPVAWHDTGEVNPLALASRYLTENFDPGYDVFVDRISMSPFEARATLRYFPWDFPNEDLDPGGWFRFLCQCPRDISLQRWAYFCYQVNHTCGGTSFHNHNIHYLKLNFLDLIIGCTRHNPSERLTLEEIRQHPWMAGILSSTVADGEWIAPQGQVSNHPASGHGAEPTPTEIDQVQIPRATMSDEINDLYPSSPSLPFSLSSLPSPPPQNE
ncbi:hypothetical protein TrST_g3542 [Triparma strigata]|uniref:Protein kinase domain-containing protein n=1 Tax=Triparma strigata TaxID=1606541 RepID=A0A9W7AXH8_9STRA|nr:hypothetical protein TrST_g3542 [Triparma strigata]